MLTRRPRARGGFTLLEILLAIAIFALGGVAILALFIAQANRAKLAADANRAVEIATSVRTAIEAAVQSPPTVIGSGDTARMLYPFSIPFASLSNESPRYGDNTQTAGETSIDVIGWDGERVPTYFLELPKQPFRGSSNVQRGTNVTFFPADLKTVLGQQVSSPQTGRARGGQTGDDLRVFFWRPDIMSIGGTYYSGERLDNDDSDIYSFNFRVDRSVARTDIKDPVDGSVNSLVPGLYVVRLRVFRGYNFTANARNMPIHEFQFTVAATE